MAWEDHCVRLIFLDNGELKGTVERRGGYRLPHL